jgi:Tfp pilus assembly protein PilV
MSIKIKPTKLAMLEIIEVNQRGIGLVETMLALGIGLIIITSMVSLSIFTLRASLQNKLAFNGTQSVNQQVELVRAYRDSLDTWGEFVQSLDGTLGLNCFTSDCHMNESGVLTVLSGQLVSFSGTPEEMRKSFRVSDQSGGAKTLLRISATASWRVGAATKYANNYTELSDWRGN